MPGYGRIGEVVPVERSLFLIDVGRGICLKCSFHFSSLCSNVRCFGPLPYGQENNDVHSYTYFYYKKLNKRE